MTGLAAVQVDELVARVYQQLGAPLPGRRALTPYRAVLVVLVYLRQNISQHVLGELFDCSQATLSQAIARIRPVLNTVRAPLSEQMAKQMHSTVRIDGFLAPTGDRRESTFTSGMYRGRRHRCGFNVLTGRSTELASMRQG